MASPEDDDDLIPDSGAVFTFGRSRFADNLANKFWIKNDPILQISCGDEHSAVVTERGRLYVFGSNDWGQLGLGHKKPTNKPSFVKVLKPEKIIQVACGRTHTIVSTASNKLYSFGGNEDGQLGHGDKNNETFPKVLEALSSIVIKEISCGAYHSIVLTGDGEVYVWGLNSEGQLGIGMNEEESPLPVKIDTDEPVISVSCGYYHTTFVTSNGLLYTFGEDETGKLGLSGSQLDDTSRPQTIPALDNDSYIQVSCGARHTVAVTKRGLCYSWGDGSHGQLGHGTMCQEVSSPKLIELLSKHKVVQVSCGDSHTAAVTDNGKIFTFGDGRHGKLGQGDECFSNLFKPAIINRFREFHVNSVSCGGCHMLVRAVHATSKESDNEDEEDSLISSMRSEFSIKEANMTLKPGNMTFPTVSPRDKRRHKEDQALSQSVNLNGSLNNSLTMAQLSRRELPQLPSSFDRSKLPKIPGMLPAKKNSVEDQSRKKSSDNDDRPTEKPPTDDDMKTKKNKRLVAEISFSRNEPAAKKLEETTSRPVPALPKRIDRNSDAKKDIDVNKNVSERSKTDKDFVDRNNKKNRALSRSGKGVDEEEDEEDSTYESDEPSPSIKKTRQLQKKNEDKLKKRSKDIDSGEDEEMEDDENEYETESEEEQTSVNKQSKQSLNKKIKEESEEEDDDEDEVDGKRGVVPKQKNSKKINITPKPPTKMLVKQKKKVVEEEDEEDEDEEDEDDEDDEETEYETEYETEEEEEEDEEEEEESEEELSVKKSKGKIKGKEAKKEENIEKRKNVDKKNKSKKQKEEEEEEEDEEEEEKEEEDEEEDDDESKGKNKKSKSKNKKEKDSKKKNKKEDKNNKKKKKKDEEDDEEDEEEIEEEDKTNKDGEKNNEKVEEQKSGGFFSFLKRNKKPAPATEAGPESKPSSPTNDAQRSKACIIL